MGFLKRTTLHTALRAIPFLVGLTFWGCSFDSQAQDSQPVRASEIPSFEPHAISPKARTDDAVASKQDLAQRHIQYPWIHPQDKTLSVPLVQKFNPPAGFRRLQFSPGSFGAWLRHLPMRTDRKHVLSFSGQRLERPSAGIVLMDVGKRDLQQCADSAIRLHAEFLWASKFAEAAQYHFTSGDLSKWTAWRQGERYRIHGRKLARLMGKARSNSHAAYRRWLDVIFTYAGTLSLHRDTEAVGEKDYAPGDIFLLGGSPGHAVMLIDLAQNEAGEVIGLIGQGFMPAEDFHILTDSGFHVIDGVWFKLPKGMNAPVSTPSWPTPFSRKAARRFYLPHPLRRL